MQYEVKALTLAALLVGSTAANAALIDRGDGFIYDDVLKITWTQNGDLDPIGRTWYERTAWADGLSLTHGGTVYDDWRLPSMDLNGDRVIVYCSTATEAECRDNELGYLFFQYDVSPASPGLFTNVTTLYWSSTDYDADGWTCNSGPEGNCAWRQGVTEDSHNYVRKVYGDDGLHGYGGWAVRDGDVDPLIDPGTLLQQLADAVVGVGSGKSLIKKVELAQTYYAVPDVQSTCAVLTDFVDQITSSSTGKKPKIGTDEARSLIGDAQVIMDAIGCN